MGLLSIGTLIGAIIAAFVADLFGRRVAIVFGNVLFWIGMIVQMTATYTWYQIALGRWVAGLGGFQQHNLSRIDLNIEPNLL